MWPANPDLWEEYEEFYGVFPTLGTTTGATSPLSSGTDNSPKTDKMGTASAMQAQSSMRTTYVLGFGEGLPNEGVEDGL